MSRRLATWLLVALVVLTALLVALTVPRSQGGDLDPDSAAPSGSRAVVQILRDQGVRVTVVRKAADVERTGFDARTTLVVVQPQLAPLRTLDQLALSPAALVLVEPDAVTLDAVGVAAAPRGPFLAATAEPGCTDPVAVRAGPVSTGGGLGYADLRGDGDGSQVCYRNPDDPTTGSVLVLGGGGTRKVALLGQADVLRNEHLADQGNAALALGVLGSRPQLLWYVPDPLELGQDGAPSLSSLLPTWVRWVALQLGVAAVLALFWRGRRLGRLVTEPLPVVVRAAQTQEGRARLYRQFGGQDRAAATLRTAALRRLARRFAVGQDSPPEVVADLVASATGRDPLAVRAVLLGPPVTGDAGLVTLADQLDAIEKDVSS